MAGAHDAEVAVVDGRDLHDVEPFGGCDHGCIDGAEWKVVVLGDESGDAEQVTGVHGFQREVAGGEITEEPYFRAPSKPSRDQVGNLGQNERWDDQRARMCFE